MTKNTPLLFDHLYVITPARAFVKCIKGHNSYYGCDKCNQKGIWSNGMVFSAHIDNLRTDQSFRNKVHSDHHKELSSPLLELPIDMIRSFPLDYMHLVCLGVMWRLIFIWIGKHYRTSSKLRSSDILTLSNIMNARKFWPSEMSRRPRSVSEIDLWKATELRNFLLYIGCVYLKTLLPKYAYKHFMLLFVSISILVNPHFCKAHILIARKCLQKFVSQFSKIYPESQVVYNIHSLLHLCDDVENFGNLDSFSAFPFENFLYSVKRMLFKPNQELQQICKRILEKESKVLKCMVNETVLHSNSGPTAGLIGNQFSEFRTPSFKLSLNERDCYVLLLRKL